MTTSYSSTEEEHIISLVSIMAMNMNPSTRYWRGRFRGSRPDISRGPCSWFRNYLNAHHIYSCSHFRRRFRIPRSLFRKFERELPDVEPYLTQIHDAAGRSRAAPMQKISSALRRLADGCPFSFLDDQSRMSIETMRQSFRAFIRAIEVRYGYEF